MGSSFIVNRKGKTKVGKKKVDKKHRVKSAGDGDRDERRLRKKRKKEKLKQKSKPASSSKALAQIDTLALNPSVEGKLKKKLEKLKAKKARLENNPALEKIVSGVKSGEVKLSKKSINDPRSEEDFRQIHVRKIVKLHRMCRILEREILGSDKASGKIYQLVQVYDRIDRSVEGLQNLRTPDQKVDVINRKVLEPVFRRVVTMMGDMINDIQREVKKEVGNLVKKVDSEKAQRTVSELIKDLASKKGAELQTIYDTGLNQLETVAEEEL